jgi:hypothetical protein
VQRAKCVGGSGVITEHPRAEAILHRQLGLAQDHPARKQAAEIADQLGSARHRND